MLILPSQTHLLLGLDSGESVWWDSNWEFRRRVDVTERSGYQLTDFPVEVTFEHGGKAQPDGDDIRIVSGGIEIPSYVSRLNSTHATVLFEIGVSALGTRSIYVYYSNPSAVTPRYDKVPLRVSEGRKGYARALVEIDTAQRSLIVKPVAAPARAFCLTENMLSWQKSPLS
jgi:hypothetical protein